MAFSFKLVELEGEICAQFRGAGRRFVLNKSECREELGRAIAEHDPKGPTYLSALAAIANYRSPDENEYKPHDV